ncbi:ATP-binding protein [Streptomyces decoyicus]|uniref:ATP-binding protein n=1 Tax=Streptomyces decoyicus TaxID=249567 RepID=UPI002E19A4E3|nr:ATP-binding protein [Streptomyces decoyicus]
MPYRTRTLKSASLHVPSEVAAVSVARRRVVAVVRSWCLPLASDAVETLELLAGEVIANAVVHTRNGCHVAVSWNGVRVRLEAEDVGPALVLGAASAASDEEHGRGLQLVECLAKAWGSRRTATGKTVWFEIDVRAPLTSRTPAEPHDTEPTRPALQRTASPVLGGGRLAGFLPQTT